MGDLIKPVLIKDSRIDNINSSIGYGVFSGSGYNNYYQYNSVSANATQMIFNCAIPSDNTLIDRNILIQATYKIKLTITGVAANATAFNYGLGECYQAFPIHSSIKNMTCSINNNSFTVNTQDILQQLIKMIDPKDLQKYNNMTPTLPDLYFNNYIDAVGSKADPTGDYKSAGYDNLLIPRGAHPLDAISVVHNISGGGTNTSLKSTNVGDVFVITLTSTFTEPLFMSPWLFGAKNDHNNGCLSGVQTINFNINLDTSLKRFFTTNNTNNISITFDETDPITNARILFNFLTPQEIDKIPSRNTVPFIDYPVYISSDSDSIAPTVNKSIYSQNYNINQIPDLFIICVRKPLASLTIKDTNSFLPIRNISVNFNNTSGLLSSATVQDLYRLSKINGSVQSWYEFYGYAGKYNTNITNTALTQYLYTTSGSMLLINPAKDLGLPYYLSNGSIGNYNIQFKIDVVNNTNTTFIPEIVLLCVNSGILTTYEDNTDVYTGLLSKEIVVNTVVKQQAVPSASYNRLIGGQEDKQDSHTKLNNLIK